MERGVIVEIVSRRDGGEDDEEKGEEEEEEGGHPVPLLWCSIARIGLFFAYEFSRRPRETRKLTSATSNFLPLGIYYFSLPTEQIRHYCGRRKCQWGTTYLGEDVDLPFPSHPFRMNGRSPFTCEHLFTCLPRRFEFLGIRSR